MKRLLFVIPEYSHGGTNKSLENLLGLIDHFKYEVSIYCLYEDGGDYYKKVFAPYILKKSRLYYWLHDNVLTRKFIGLCNKLTGKDYFTFLYKRETSFLQKKYNFNVVVGYQEGLATRFVSYFTGPKKVVWTHGIDFQNRKCQKVDQIYQNFHFDNIVCVSETAAATFRRVYPELAQITVGIHNALNVASIIEKANSPIEWAGFDTSYFTILSIGRFNWVKQFEKIPDIANKMRQLLMGVKFHWYIIGSGSEKYDETKAAILKNNVEDCVFLVPEQDNPYPYIKKSNLLVCTSKFESFSYVVAEAKILSVPVVCSDFPVANEIITDDCGWVCPLPDMPLLLSDIIKNIDDQYEKKRVTAQQFYYDNKTIMKRVESVFESVTSEKM